MYSIPVVRHTRQQQPCAAFIPFVVFAFFLFAVADDTILYAVLFKHARHSHNTLALYLYFLLFFCIRPPQMVNSPRALVFNADPVGHPIRSPSLRAAWESTGGGGGGRSAWGTDVYPAKRGPLVCVCLLCACKMKGGVCACGSVRLYVCIIYMCVCVCLCLYVDVCVSCACPCCVCVCICMCACVCPCVCVCVCPGGRA